MATNQTLAPQMEEYVRDGVGTLLQIARVLGANYPADNLLTSVADVGNALKEPLASIDTSLIHLCQSFNHMNRTLEEIARCLGIIATKP